MSHWHVISKHYVLSKWKYLLRYVHCNFHTSITNTFLPELTANSRLKRFYWLKQIQENTYSLAQALLFHLKWQRFQFRPSWTMYSQNGSDYIPRPSAELYASVGHSNRKCGSVIHTHLAQLIQMLERDGVMMEWIHEMTTNNIFLEGRHVSWCTEQMQA